MGASGAVLVEGPDQVVTKTSPKGGLERRARTRSRRRPAPRAGRNGGPGPGRNEDRFPITGRRGSSALLKYINIYIYILEIKARQRRAKRNIYLTLLVSQMKAGYPTFGGKCSNELMRLGGGLDDAKSLENECATISLSSARAAFGRPPRTSKS